MEAFVWSAQFETHLDIVDEQHKTLVKMLNEAAPWLANPDTADPKRLTKLVQELGEYAVFHFTTEERLMAEYDIDKRHTKGHLQAHRDFAEEVRVLAGGESGVKADTLNLLRFLTSWLVFHILGTDKAMAEQVRAIRAGKTPAAAFEAAGEPADSGAVKPLLQALLVMYQVINARNRALMDINRSLTVAEAQLQRSNLELEDKVQRRTAELQAERDTLAKTLQQLEQTQSQLLQSEKMASVGQLAAGVAHEINNPIGFVSSNLSTLKTYVERLLHVLQVYGELEPRLPDDASLRQRLLEAKEQADLDYLVEDVKDLLRESAGGLDRVKKIVQDLKDFSHVDEADWQQADLNAGLDATINVAWNEIKYKAEVDKDYGELPPVRCLSAQVNQVFMNLLVNAAQAIDASNGRGRITLKTRVNEAGDAVRISISDSGCGMPPEVQRRIFEPFYTTKPVGKGTGLGMSIAWDIIQKHRGTIEVQSTVGQGTTFVITLPVAGPADAEPTAGAA